MNIAPNLLLQKDLLQVQNTVCDFFKQELDSSSTENALNVNYEWQVLSLFEGIQLLINQYVDSSQITAQEFILNYLLFISKQENMIHHVIVFFYFFNQKAEQIDLQELPIDFCLEVMKIPHKKELEINLSLKKYPPYIEKKDFPSLYQYSLKTLVFSFNGKIKFYQYLPKSIFLNNNLNAVQMENLISLGNEENTLLFLNFYPEKIIEVLNILEKDNLYNKNKKFYQFLINQPVCWQGKHLGNSRALKDTFDVFFKKCPVAIIPLINSSTFNLINQQLDEEKYSFWAEVLYTNCVGESHPLKEKHFKAQNVQGLLSLLFTDISLLNGVLERVQETLKKYYAFATYFMDYIQPKFNEIHQLNSEFTKFLCLGLQFNYNLSFLKDSSSLPRIKDEFYEKQSILQKVLLNNLFENDKIHKTDIL